MLSLTSLTKNIVNFKGYEKKVLELSKKVGATSIKNQLEEIDRDILKNRNKKVFRNKGKKRLDFKTTLAEVEIYRRVYVIDEKELENLEDKENNSLYQLARKRLDLGFKTICLLDELLSLKKFGKLSEGVVELIVKYIQDNSYRKTSVIVNDITGLNITGTTVWNIVKIIGNLLKEKEKYESEKSDEELIECKNKDNHIIFNELDGVYFTLQGKDRKDAVEVYKKRHPDKEVVPKSVRKKELKVVTIYEGWKKEGKNRNSLVNKKIFAQVIDNCKIKELTKMYVNNTYDQNKLKLIVINSDGGTWTKDKTRDKIIYQLDDYHIKDMINRQIREKEDRKEMLKYLKNKEYSKMLELSESLKYKYDGEVTEIDKLSILQEYIRKNMNSFRRYQDTELFKKVKQEGFTYKNLGTQESTNYSKITKRMKRRRMSFSIEGADNLSRVIAMAGSYDYDGLSNMFEVQILPQKAIDEVEKYIKDIEINIEKQKEIKKKINRTKYNDSFNTHIPGLELNIDREMVVIKNMILG